MTDRTELERAERKRIGRMSWGYFLLGMGGMAMAIGFISGDDSWIGQVGADGWLIAAGGTAAVIGALTAWKHRPGEAARRLDQTAGARDRAQKERARMLTVIPFSMIIFGGLSVKAISAVQAGTAEFHDWGLIATALLYAWMGPLFVMGWDGAALRQRKLLEDELTRHHRGRALIPAFILLLVLMTGLVVLGLWSADWAFRLLPLALCVAGAAAAVRFVQLERQAERED